MCCWVNIATFRSELGGIRRSAWQNEVWMQQIGVSGLQISLHLESAWRGYMYSLRKDASINSIVVLLLAVEESAYNLYWR